MNKVRIGVIGLGNMGLSHARDIVGSRVPYGELAAVCDIDDERLGIIKKEIGDSIELYNDEGTLLKSDSIDGVIIATPHYHHSGTAIKAFKKGLHVLCEKPAGVYTRQVRQMNEQAVKSKRVFSMMYNQRTNPLYRKMKDLIESGELGDIKRTCWIITSWYRPQSYYDSGDWRATWAGEGGGVLLNQCPHQLDLWQWICGMPKRVKAFCSIGRYHDIEVEDDVTAYAEYQNGATGLFVTSTGEAAGTNRFEIVADRGKAVIENGKLEFYRLRIPERQFNREFKGNFGEPECWKCDIPIRGEETGHAGIINNWIDAILNGEDLIAPGVEGINGLSLSNAMYLSSWTDNWTDISFDEDLFYTLLQERINSSKYKKSEH